MQPSRRETPLSKPSISFHFESRVLVVEVETERLYIRSYKDDDFENCISLYGDEAITKYFDHGRPRSKLEIENLIKERGRRYFSRGEPFGLFSIFDKKNMTFIGQVDLVPTGEKGAVEIGCILCKQYHGQGISTEAIKAFVINYVDELNSKQLAGKNIAINKVIATAHPENTASHKIVRGLGMTFDRFQERFGNPRLWYSYIPKTAVKK